MLGVGLAFPCKVRYAAAGEHTILLDGWGCVCVCTATGISLAFFGGRQHGVPHSSHLSEKRSLPCQGIIVCCGHWFCAGCTASCTWALTPDYYVLIGGCGDNLDERHAISLFTFSPSTRHAATAPCTAIVAFCPCLFRLIRECLLFAFIAVTL